MPKYDPPTIAQTTTSRTSRPEADSPTLSPEYSDGHGTSWRQGGSATSAHVVIGSKPPQLDLSTLFPTWRAEHGPLLSPVRLTHSPSNLSLVSEPGTDTNGVPQEKSSVLRPLQLALPTDSQPGESFNEKAPLQASRCYDGFSDHATTRTQAFLDADGNTEFWSPEAENCLRYLRKESRVGSRDVVCRATATSSSTGHDVGNDTSSHSGDEFISSPTSKARHRPSKQRTSTIFYASDLALQSVLALSSSDGEGHSDGEGSSGETSLTTLEEDDYDTDAIICSAQTIRIKPAGNARTDSHLRAASISRESSPLRSVGGTSTTQQAGRGAMVAPATLARRRTRSRASLAQPDREGRSERPSSRSLRSRLARTSWLNLRSAADTADGGNSDTDDDDETNRSIISALEKGGLTVSRRSASRSRSRSRSQGPSAPSRGPSASGHHRRKFSRNESPAPKVTKPSYGLESQVERRVAYRFEVTASDLTATATGPSGIRPTGGDALAAPETDVPMRPPGRFRRLTSAFAHKASAPPVKTTHLTIPSVFERGHLRQRTASSGCLAAEMQNRGAGEEPGTRWMPAVPRRGYLGSSGAFFTAKIDHVGRMGLWGNKASHFLA